MSRSPSLTNPETGQWSLRKAWVNVPFEDRKYHLQLHPDGVYVRLWGARKSKIYVVPLSSIIELALGGEWFAKLRLFAHAERDMNKEKAEQPPKHD